MRSDHKVGHKNTPSGLARHSRKIFDLRTPEWVLPYGNVVSTSDMTNIDNFVR